MNVFSFTVLHIGRCKRSDYPDFANLRRSTRTIDDASKFVLGSQYQFKSESRETCRRYKFRAVVAAT